MIALLPVIAAVGLLFINSVVAQTLDQHSFGFKFQGSTTPQILQCSTVMLANIALNTTTNYLGKGPFTVLAFEAGGVSDSQNGGSDPNNIPWQVRHAPGAEIYLTIIDANGDYAGIPPSTRPVLKGTSTSCMPTLPDNLPRVTGNVSDTTLQTCQNWGLNITGGVPPYSLQILVTNAPVYTNVTATDTLSNYFKYPNRADPNNNMIVSVSDSTGRFGYSSQSVRTAGGSNTTCPGLGSAWGQASQVEIELQQQAAAEKARKQSENRTVIIASVVSIVGLVVLCILSFFIWRAVVRSRAGVRQGQPRFDMETVAAYFPPPTMQSQAQAQSAQIDPTVTPFTSSQQLLAREPSVASSSVLLGRSYSQRDELPPLPVGDSDPTPAARKAAEAASERRAALARDQSISSYSYGRSDTQGSYYPYSSHGSLRRGQSIATLSDGSAPSVVGTDDDGTVILQHRDGGLPEPGVFELPPSYDPGSYRRPPSGFLGIMSDEKPLEEKPSDEISD